MDSASSLELRAAKKKATPPTVNPGAAAPTKFFLRKEKDIMEHSSMRGRRSSQASVDNVQDAAHTTPIRSSLVDSTFGVQSLEETIRSPANSEDCLSRSTSQSSRRSSTSTQEVDADGHVLSRKRKTGNRVHPSILAAGRRIISSDVAQSPSLSVSPASIPFTPTKSPRHARSATPSTPRSASPKSFRLSDEDSVADDHSQAVVSSSGDEEDHAVERTPQLVMPSVPVTARRPFTEQGRQLGRARIMVVGPRGVGKTSFIRSLVRCTEHIVHVDHLPSPTSQTSFSTDGSEDRSSEPFAETQASTRPLPFWSDVEQGRSRSNSIGSSILERNLTFVDTPGLCGQHDIDRILTDVKSTLRRAADLNSLSDAEIVGLLSGEGGLQIDAVFYLFEPEAESVDPAGNSSSAPFLELIQYLCKWTNFIPLISRADSLTPDALQARKSQIRSILRAQEAEPYKLVLRRECAGPEEPLAVSSALSRDDDTIDASILMSSQYLQPLVPSELGPLVESFFEPENFARMRHTSATKVVAWKRRTLPRLDLRALESPYLRSRSPGALSTGSLLEESSKVLVPHSSSSFYRSPSPANSDPCLSSRRDHALPAEPLRQIRLAKWAQDLQKGLENERRKYQELYNRPPTGWTVDEEKNEKQALVSGNGRPARGRLGGEMAIIDPRDPLGVLALGQAFGRSGFLTLQILGGCGLLGAAAYWIFKNWIAVQGFIHLRQPPDASNAVVESVRRHMVYLFDEMRAFLGMDG